MHYARYSRLTKHIWFEGGGKSGIAPVANRQTYQILGGLKEIEGINDVSLTTNGVTLYRHLPKLIASGLDNVNISLDTFVPQKFSFLTRRPGKF